MTRDQIEKRAVAIKNSQNYHMSFEDAQDYISKCGFDIPWNDGDVFVDDREITRTIGNVLKWRINSVWHDIDKEKPMPGKHVVNEHWFDFVAEDWKDLDRIMKKWPFKRWAYVDDLMPDGKEEER